MEVTTRTIIGISFLVLGIIFLLKLAGIVEAFTVESDATALAAATKYELVNQQTKCGAKTSCSTCLDTAGCGWCPAAGKCIPKVNDYPIVPHAGPTDVTATIKLNEPLFQCPSSTFVKDKTQCTDVVCSEKKSCRTCAENVKCGWCGASSKCLPKGADGSLTDLSGNTCAAATAVINSALCPTKVCNTITDCEECTGTQGCSFCEAAKKCVRLQDKMDMVNGVMKVVEAKDAKVDGCNEESALSSPSQCPSVRKVIALQEAPTAADLDSAQDNTVGGSGTTGSIQAPMDTSSPVSPATTYYTVNAPGVSRPVGSSSVRPSYPAAAGLDGTGPFETYVQMLVKSELAAQGVPTNEPFTVPSIVDTVQNASRQIQNSLKGVFQKPGGVRI